MGGIEKGDVGRQQAEDHDKSRSHPHGDNRHLEEMGFVDGVGPAGGGVDDNNAADHKNGIH